MWDNVIITALVLACLAGVVMTALRLPGTWLIAGAALGYGWWSGWMGIGTALACIVVAIAIVGEIMEFALTAITAQKAGASRQAAWGGLIGGFLGMLFLASLLSLPMPIVGTMIGAIAGALVGCFGGAMIAELAVRKKLAQSTKVGLFSALGFVLGMTAKIAIALVMSGLVITSAVCTPDEDVRNPEVTINTDSRTVVP